MSDSYVSNSHGADMPSLDASTNDTHRKDPWHRWQMEDLHNRQPSQTHPIKDDQIDLEAERNATLEALYDQAHQEGYQAGYQAGLEEGRQAGLEQGMEEGRQKGREEVKKHGEELLAPLLPMAQRFSEALNTLDDQIAASLVELAVATGRQLAGNALKERPEQIVDIVRELLHLEPSLSGQPRLWLQPEDLELTRVHLGHELEAVGWRLQPDDTLTRGGCRVTSDSGELDATWEQRCAGVIGQIRRRPPPQTPEADR